MAQTTKEILAKTEFWAMQAMNSYDDNSDQHKILREALNLIKKASDNEEEAAWQQVLKAAQIKVV